MISMFDTGTQIRLVLVSAIVLAGSLGATRAHSNDSNEAEPAASATQADAPTISTAILSGETLFKRNADKLSDEGVVALKQLINDLKSYSLILSIKVIGHTDSRGSAIYNQDLSARRADYIKSFFVEEFPNIDIFSIGAGESTPLVSNETVAGRNRNRRVEIQVLAEGIQP